MKKTISEALTDGLSAIALSNMNIAENLEKTAKALDRCVDSIGNVAESIDLVSSAINNGISKIADENKAARLSNEYYTLLHQLTIFKDNHPEAKLEISPEDISNIAIKLSREMMITLSFFFTKTNLFARFKIECENGICKPEEWFYSFLRRSKFTVGPAQNGHRTYLLKIGEYEEQIYDETMVDLFGYDRFCKLLREYNYKPTSLSETNCKGRIEELNNVFDSDDAFADITEGYAKLSNWVCEEYVKKMIHLLRKTYSNAVIQHLTK